MGLVRRVGRPEGAGSERRRDGRDVEGLVRQLSSENPEERRRATLDLWGEPTAVPPLLDAWAREPDGAAREAMLLTLAAHDSVGVGSALAADLRHEDADRRTAAVRTLQTMPIAVAALADELLADSDPDVRILTVMVLSAVPHPDVPRWLRAVVSRDDTENVVGAAVDVAFTVAGSLAGELAPVAADRFPANPYLGYLASLAARA